ncbi:hypothetical protein SAMN05444392_1098 [Seinonella peptonophila]|uniref:Uncharacterized protein n=2 Tax=Seinonella peptonophila TaxID=112248 RepID=A0A1M4ZFK7_9BACL|nr:hypothetical protein SAMN05444392_1098 [Seinonella peptonophila]
MSTHRKRRKVSGFVLTGLLSMAMITTSCAPSMQGSKQKKKLNVPVTSYRFDTAGNMFAYSEFELSGEPMVESLGLNLDLLKPEAVDKPSRFDYTAGIESYEYSEEAMYEVVEKSGLGIHLVNGPMIQQLASAAGKNNRELLGERIKELAEQVGYPIEQIQQNMYPTVIEYSGGDPHYTQKVDTGKFADGEKGAYTPNYQVDFASLRWDRKKMEKTLIPSAYGSTFLKQALWAGDFLGGVHTKDKDEEKEATSSSDDKDPNIGLGVSSADGMQGMILAEEIWNKLAFIHENLFYNPQTGQLEKAQGSKYDPSKGLQYLPHEVVVDEKVDDLGANAEKLTVKNPSSDLQDQWMMLWPASEYFGVMDQRDENKNINPAFRALTDGKPFPSAPKENLDQDTDNDIDSTDPYSLNRGLLLQQFRNLQTMHWNEQEGIFVTKHDGKTQGKVFDPFQAGYTVESLRIFQRAYDGLPVGYASGEDAEGLKTEEGKQALAMIQKQADFILAKLIEKNGLVANGYEIGNGKVGGQPKLLAQIGAIRGLTAAYLATKDSKYRDAARKIYVAMDQYFWDPQLKTFRTEGNQAIYDPTIAGGVSAVLRLGLTSLMNTTSDSTKPKALQRKILKERYQDFYDHVIDGPSLTEGMQASEFWDTGDLYYEKDQSGNTDKDHVPQIQKGHGKYGISPILLPVEVKLNREK